VDAPTQLAREKVIFFIFQPHKPHLVQEQASQGGGGLRILEFVLIVYIVQRGFTTGMYVIIHH
jgi:hypothetical protein